MNIMKVETRVRAFLTNKDKILLVREANEEIWETPGGGLLEGETVQQAFEREMLEELGMKVECEELLSAYVAKFLKSRHIHLIYEGKILKRVDKPEKGTLLKWFSKNEVKRMLEKNEVDGHDKEVFEQFCFGRKQRTIAGSIAVLKKDTKYLLLRRSEKESFPGIWEFVVGKLEKNENFLTNAIKEVREKTSLIPKKIKLIGIIDEFRDNTHLVAQVFFVTSFVGNVKISDEHNAYKWCTREEILSMEKVSIDTINILKNFGV
jgi:ADP-ribose pyrophosphatase YjhB (NUDIX family)